jgi:hypothetical protein
MGNAGPEMATRATNAARLVHGVIENILVADPGAELVIEATFLQQQLCCGVGEVRGAALLPQITDPRVQGLDVENAR